jgi:hypothetical protein
MDLSRRLLLASPLLLLMRHKARGQDWSTDPQVKNWFEGLMQPDNPAPSCCGEADSYWSDTFTQTEDGLFLATVTDPRDDKLPPNEYGTVRTRRHIPFGTRIVIPDGKVKWDKGNPTGHGILFLAQAGDDPQVYCYLPPTMT